MAGTPSFCRWQAPKAGQRLSRVQVKALDLRSTWGLTQVIQDLS
jgi:hypothetical protein